MLNKVRRPSVAGQFYDGNEENLKQTIENCFLDDRGPKSLPQIISGNKKITKLETRDSRTPYRIE